MFTADEAPNIAETKAGEVLTVRITITKPGQPVPPRPTPDIWDAGTNFHLKWNWDVFPVMRAAATIDTISVYRHFRPEHQNTSEDGVCWPS